MKRWPTAQYRQGGNLNGEVIIEFRPPFIATTLQREQGKVYAETKAYIIRGTYANGDIKLAKHPTIKGRPAS